MKTLLLVLAAAAALGYAAHLRRGSPLEGSSWEVKTKADSFLAFSHRDTLAFDDGRLTSSRWAKEGFAPAGYDATREGGANASFGATVHRDGKGTVRWQGFARGDRMEGTVQWTTADGRTRRYKFKGVRAPGA